MLPIINNAGSAIRAFSKGLATTATNTANLLTPNFRPLETVYESQPEGGVAARVQEQPDADGVALEEQVVNQITAEKAIKANLQMIRATDQTIGLLLDIQA